MKQKEQSLTNDKAAEPLSSLFHVYTFEQFSSDLRENVSFNEHRNDILSGHTHDFYEVNYLYRGTCTNVLMGKSYTMHQYEAFIMRPGTVHKAVNPDGALMVNFLIKPSFFREHFADTENNGPFREFCQDSKREFTYPFIRYGAVDQNPLIDLLRSEFLCRQEDRHLLYEACLLQFLVTLNRRCTDVTLPERVNYTSFSMVHAILQYIQEEYATVNLSILSEKFNYSPEHLSRMIYKNTGSHFTDILMGIRMNCALKYMQNTSLSIAEVVERSGFGSVEYFYRQFKKRFGISPQAFRRQHYNYNEN